MSDICQHYKFGYCRYLENCFKKHITEVCEDKNCDVKNCNFRHPKTCTFFEQFTYCKFGDYCLYEHKNEDKKNDKIAAFEILLNEKSLIIESLEQKLCK